MSEVSKVIWANRDTKSAKSLRPHPYITVQEIAPGKWEEYQRHFYPGALWVIVNPLTHERPNSSYAQHLYPYVLYSNKSIADFKPGEFAIYIGPIKVHEENRNGIGIMIERHCFLIRGNRYMASSLMDFVPC